MLPRLLQEWEDAMLPTKNSQASASSKEADDVHGGSAPVLSSQKKTRKVHKTNPSASCDPTTAWLKLSETDKNEMQCPVDKDVGQARIRRRTG